MAKYIYFCTGHNQIQKLYKKVLAFHQSQVVASEIRKSSLIWCLKISRRVTILQISMIFGAAAMLWVNPIYTILFADKWELMVFVLLPMIDHTTVFGFTLNFISQACMQCVGVIMVPCFDSLMIIFVLHVVPFVDHLRLDLEELRAHLEGVEPDHKTTKEKLGEIVKRHQALLE